MVVATSPRPSENEKKSKVDRGPTSVYLATYCYCHGYCLVIQYFIKGNHEVCFLGCGKVGQSD